MSGFTPLSLRPPLAELPAHPVHQRPKPAVNTTASAGLPNIKANQTSTPPSTPPKPENKRASASVAGITSRSPVGVDHFQSTVTRNTNDSTDRNFGALKLYDRKYESHEELGHGVWSNVCFASEVPEPPASEVFPPSPPISPTNALVPGLVPISKKTLAVKKPCRRDAHKILEKEARILTFLHADNEETTHLVPFRGFDVAHHSIILDAVPLTLETHAVAARQRPLSTKTMFDPVLGAEEWVDLAQGLISGLLFLHGKGCVHGDIKPANILLRPDANGKSIPLYCDFSSSRVNSKNVEAEIEEVSAVTMDYTSPELLNSLYKRTHDRAVATFPSDIFALAVTLIFSATGESPYACARMDLQKLGMAKEGSPLEYAARGEQASRVMEGRAVDKALRVALARDPEQRLNGEKWKAEVEDVSTRWRDGGWTRGG